MARKTKIPPLSLDKIKNVGDEIGKNKTCNVSTETPCESMTRLKTLKPINLDLSLFAIKK